MPTSFESYFRLYQTSLTEFPNKFFEGSGTSFRRLYGYAGQQHRYRYFQKREGERLRAGKRRQFFPSVHLGEQRSDSHPFLSAGQGGATCRCSKAQGNSFKMPENRANSRNLHYDSAIFLHFLHSFSANSVSLQSN